MTRRDGSQVKLPALISYGDKVFRPAGYRVPLSGEQYIGKDGHVKKQQGNQVTSGERLILREFDGEQDFQGAQR